MSRKLMFLGVLSLVLAPGGALSLGLGEVRLSSYLNQPLDARIDLALGSREELDSLKVGLAPAETFERYGVARPAMLQDLKFSVDRSSPGGAVVQVTSGRPIVEPFLTFLIEARWAGGRVVREYTVLLDPPVYMPGQGEAPQARRIEPSQSPGAGSRPAPAAAAPAAAPRQGSFTGAEYGPVQRNETLYRIAQRVSPDGGLSTNQVMLALFNANPQAFEGNINRLKAGAVLRVPTGQDMAAIGRGDATSEVRRQTNAWREGTTPSPERLELAPPDSGTPSAPATRVADAERPSRAEPGAEPGVMSALADLRRELGETRQLIEVKDAEIAALQRRLSEIEGTAPATAGQPGGPAAGTAAATAPAQPAESPGQPAAGTEPREETPAAAAPATTAQPESRPAAPPPSPTVTEPSFMDGVMGVLSSLWLWLLIGLALVAAAGIYFLKNREARSVEDDLAETGTWGTLEPPRAAAAAAVATGAAAEAGRTQKMRALDEGPRESILVEEQQTPGVRREPAGPPPAERREEARPATDEDFQYPFEDTIAGETGINLDQSDPLAEADFHMAYGLYDQAAEIVKKAIEREPDRYDLRRKLIDICFVWGNSDEFLEQARAVHGMQGPERSADWGKIAIMGRQIAPGDPLFAGAERVEELDVSLDEEAGTATELDLATEASDEADWLDFDVGESRDGRAGVELGDTREQPALKAGETSEQTAEIDLEDLGIDLELGETGEHALRDLAERAPEFSDEETGELPAAEEDGTLQMALDELRRKEDDEAPTTSADQPEFEADSTWVSDSKDEPTLAGEQESPIPRREEEETAEVEAVDENLDLDDLTEALKANIGDTREMEAPPSDDDATQLAPGMRDPWGGTDQSAAETEADTQEMPPVTMSEVGTKLDLARAYIDMGDPDGARSILEEVLDEGDDAQQEEARQLLDSLA